MQVFMEFSTKNMLIKKNIRKKFQQLLYSQKNNLAF